MKLQKGDYIRIDNLTREQIKKLIDSAVLQGYMGECDSYNADVLMHYSGEGKTHFMFIDEEGIINGTSNGTYRELKRKLPYTKWCGNDMKRGDQFMANIGHNEPITFISKYDETSSIFEDHVGELYRINNYSVIELSATEQTAQEMQKIVGSGVSIEALRMLAEAGYHKS